MHEGKPRIVNVVATGRFPCELDIEKLSQTLDCEERVYEPEIYPALLVKVGKKRYHLTLYGKHSVSPHCFSGTKGTSTLLYVSA